MVAILLPTTGLYAQEGGGADNPEIIFCGEGACSHSPKSGEVTPENMEIMLGESDSFGHNVVICQPGEGCRWSSVNAEDAALIYGDGTVSDEMVFGDTENESEGDEMVFSDTEAEMLLDLSGVGATAIRPRDGLWITQHHAGSMVCSGGLRIDVPAGDPSPGSIGVSGDGDMIIAESADDSMPMLRVAPGVYHSAFKVATDDGTMTLYFDEVFITEGLAIGVIYADMLVEGNECHIERRFWTEYTGDFDESPDDATDGEAATE